MSLEVTPFEFTKFALKIHRISRMFLPVGNVVKSFQVTGGETCRLIVNLECFVAVVTLGLGVIHVLFKMIPYKG